MATTEDSGHIELSGEMIRYSSATYSGWTIRASDVRVIGEATDQSGPFVDYCLCFATGPEMCYEASFYADGRDTFLWELGERLGVLLQPGLASSTDFASRILWPAKLVDKPMFKYQNVPSKTLVGRLFRLEQCEQTYSDDALAAFSS
jgi:hypothetical protein